MSNKAHYYLTTPIYYVNDVPHIGHAYTTLACDVMARFMRLDGYQVKFLTGTDEHGQKIEKSAQAAGMDPQRFADQVSENFRKLGTILNFSNDDFIRTTEPRHIRACQALWRTLTERGQIYLDSYSGWYAVRDEAFYAEEEIREGNDGVKFAPTGAEVEWISEDSYFFRLSEWQEPLLRYYEEKPDFILPPSRRNEVISFVKSGLRDLSVSRTSFGWGVKVPGDETHVMYVWIDALTNYITAVGYPATDSREYQTFWPADLHMVGKDILRFHAIYWPALLMAAGLRPPKRVFAHGWWTNEGQKISKSLGNVIDPIQLVKRYGLDQTRYFLLREVPFGNDGSFSHRAMVNRMNSELANDLGNLAQRVLSFVQKNCDGKVPEPGDFTLNDRTLMTLSDTLYSTVRQEIQDQAFHRALEAIWQVIGHSNRYIDEEAPWALRKSNPARMGTVLYLLMETLRRIAILLQPFMPGSTARLLDQLGQAVDQRDFEAFSASLLQPGILLPKPEGIFPRFREEDAAPLQTVKPA